MPVLFTKFIIALCVVLASVNVLGLEVENLYQVSVFVPNQTKELREDALKETMQQVLIKVSGHASTLQNEDIQKRVNQPNQFIQTYSYLRNSRSGGFWLKVVFAKNKIDELLTQTKQSLWGASRPLTVFWIKRNGAILRNDDKRLKPEIELAMNERGLPFFVPYVDVQDTQKLKNQPLWKLTNSELLDASKRYRAQSVVSGNISSIDGQLLYQGRVIQANSTIRLNLTAENMQALARKISANLGEILASAYAVNLQSDSIEQTAELSVKGVRDFDDYYSLMSYLKRKAGVKSVGLKNVQDSEVQLQLSLSVPWLNIAPTIKLDNKLRADLTTPNTWRWYK